MGGQAITDDSQTLEELRREIEHLRFVLDITPQIQWTADIDGNITWISSRWEKLTGTPVSAALGRGYAAFLHPDDLGPSDEAANGAIVSAWPYDVEYRLRHANGGYRWMHGRAESRVDENGNFIAWYGSTDDIHDRKMAEAEVAETLQSLRLTQESLSLAMRGGRMGWWSRDVPSDRVTWSPELEEIFGLTPGSFGGTRSRFLDFIHPDDIGKFREAVDRAAANKGDYAVEFRFRRADGTEGWMEGRGRALFDEAGEVKASYGFGIDISLEREREQVSREREQLSHSILLTAVEGILVLDLQGRMILRNPAFDALHGTQTQIVEGEPQEIADDIDVFDTEGNPVPREEWPGSRALRGERVAGLDLRIRRKDGRKEFWVRYVAAPVLSEEGEIRAAVVSMFDVTELKQAQEQARKAADLLENEVAARTIDLQASNEALQGFTYHVAHDLRSPLRGIASTSRIVQEDYGHVLPTEASSLLDRQAEAATKLGHLIDDLLRLSRLTQQELDRQNLDLSQLATEAAAEAVSSHPETKVLTQVSEGLTASADPRLLKLALGNLIENAVKYSPQGGMVRIGRREDGAYFVADEGIGIDPRYFEKVFEPFQRLHRDDEFAGTGIGLSNVRQVVARHGGKVWVESEPGRGSTFFFTLG